jgi:hypothetical protein
MGRQRRGAAVILPQVSHSEGNFSNVSSDFGDYLRDV